MKINELANSILTKIRNGFSPDAKLLFESGCGKSPAEVEFVITQLRMFGYI